MMSPFPIRSAREKPIALHAAIQRPERVSSLFLAGTGLFGFEPTIERDDPPLYREYEAAFVNQDIERAVECAKTIWLWGINGSADDIEEPAVRAFTAMYRDLLTTHPWSGPTYLDLNDVPDISHITTPMMVLIGENDTAYCQLLADFLQQNLPDVVIQRMPHVAHFPNLSQPSLFNQFLTNWLSESTKPR
jgi:pimeloyl-ACP methyl ester carboxylesterase